MNGVSLSAAPFVWLEGEPPNEKPEKLVALPKPPKLLVAGLADEADAPKIDLFSALWTEGAEVAPPNEGTSPKVDLPKEVWPKEGAVEDPNTDGLPNSDCDGAMVAEKGVVVFA